MFKYLKRIRAKTRLMRGLCPVCGSKIPAAYACICCGVQSPTKAMLLEWWNYWLRLYDGPMFQFVWWGEWRVLTFDLHYCPFSYPYTRMWMCGPFEVRVWRYPYPNAGITRHAVIRGTQSPTGPLPPCTRPREVREELGDDLQEQEDPRPAVCPKPIIKKVICPK